MKALYALWDGPVRAWSVSELLCALLILLGCIAVVFVVTKAIGITIPEWLIKIVLVIVAVAVGCFAIRFIASL